MSKCLYNVQILFVSLCLLSVMIINTDNKQTPERVERACYKAKITVTPTPTATPSPSPSPSPTPVEYEEITLEIRKDREKPFIDEVITEEELEELYLLEEV